MKDPNNTLHILFCSRLVYEKGVDIVLEVIRSVLSDKILRERIVWHIASDGDYIQEINDLSKKEKTIKFYGKVPQQELAKLMREADFLYMPSRFLETFGLTALESLSTGTPVIGISKGGLIDFIPQGLSINESDPVVSTLHLLNILVEQGFGDYPIDVTSYNRENWTNRFKKIFPVGSNLFLLHDYSQRIGGAETYIDQIMEYLPKIGYNVHRCSYKGSTSTMKRRILFIISIFAFWRGIVVLNQLKKSGPDAIWMHSILRYHGFWGVRAVKNYSKNTDIRVYISHHDLGLIAAFPQDVTDELQIPKNATLKEFLQGLSQKKKIIAYFKWLYVQLIRSVFPKNMKHIIFSPFLEKHMVCHFPDSEVLLLPHTFDENIFHP